MATHVLPPWQRTVHKTFCVFAVLLCVTLPVLFGKHRLISSSTMGIIFGSFFGLWIWFAAFTYCSSRTARTQASTLPIHTPSPIILHSPTRSDALPSSTAIRLPRAAHTTLAKIKESDVKQPQQQSQRGARFALDIEDLEDDQQHRGTRTRNSVSFQTRPRGNTTDSASSLTYPTFAAYRQAQHVNFDAFAQRVKRAFALKQDQEREEKAALQQRLHEQEEAAVRLQQGQQQQPQQRLLRPTIVRSQSSSVVDKSEKIIKTSGNRSRSSSAAGIIGDFAERIKNGSSLFFRRSSSSFAVVACNDDYGGSDSNSMTKVQPSYTSTSDKDRAGLHPVTGYQDYSTVTTDDLPTVIVLPSSPIFSSDEHLIPQLIPPPLSSTSPSPSPLSGIEIQATRSSFSEDIHP